MITKKALKLLSTNESAKGRIADATDRTTWTVNRWIKDNDVMLTAASVLSIIREETGLTNEEILDKTTAKQ